MTKHNNTRPLIAVTGPAKKIAPAWWATRFMLWLSGARACHITAASSQLPMSVDGVVIGGGDDIDPQHYGESGDAGAEYDPERDKLEIAMIKSALEAKIPILGICRGAQLINVVLGGTLFQDIRPMRVKTPNRNSLFVIKQAIIEPHSHLKQILNQSNININSLHNQAVNKLGETLQVSARDKDNFIQAFESEEKNFLLGVQWHPEYLPYQSCQRRLFRAVVDAAKQHDYQLSPEYFCRQYQR